MQPCFRVAFIFNFKKLAVVYPSSQLPAQFCSSGQMGARVVCYSCNHVRSEMRLHELCLPSFGSSLCPQARNVHLHLPLLSAPSVIAFLDDLWNMRISCFLVASSPNRKSLIHQVIKSTVPSSPLPAPNSIKHVFGDRRFSFSKWPSMEACNK